MPTADAPSGNSVPLLAGISWLLVAALTGYLAYLQWSLGSIVGSSELQGTAAWNALACLITLYFAARLIASPSRALLDRSTAWAILSVASGVIQIVGLEGVADIFALSVFGAAVAGVLSFVGRQQYPKEAPKPAPAVAAVHAATGSSGFGRAEKVVIALIVVAVVVGGYVATSFLRQPVTGGAATPGPTARPTPRVTAPPVTDPSIVRFNERVDLVDGNNNDLGSVRVVTAEEPPDILGLTAAPGNRLVAARVVYEARAAWTYNVYDWALHDATQRQYEPAGIAPDPALTFGTLSPGKIADGWVAFEAPQGGDLWLDFRSGDGTIIFSVLMK